MRAYERGVHVNGNWRSVTDTFVYETVPETYIFPALFLAFSKLSYYWSTQHIELKYIDNLFTFTSDMLNQCAMMNVSLLLASTIITRYRRVLEGYKKV